MKATKLEIVVDDVVNSGDIGCECRLEIHREGVVVDGDPGAVALDPWVGLVGANGADGCAGYDSEAVDDLGIKGIRKGLISSQDAATVIGKGRNVAERRRGCAFIVTGAGDLNQSVLVNNARIARINTLVKAHDTLE